MRLDFKAFVADTSGATAIEYGLIAALVGCLLIGSFQALGWGIYNKFDGLRATVGGT